MIWTLQTKPSHNESPGIHPHIRPRLRIPYRCEVCAHIRRCRCIWKGYEQHVLCRFRILNVDTCVLWRAPDRRWPTILHHPAPQLTSLEKFCSCCTSEQGHGKHITVLVPCLPAHARLGKVSEAYEFTAQDVFIDVEPRRTAVFCLQNLPSGFDFMLEPQLLHYSP